MQVCGVAGPRLPPLPKVGVSPGLRPWDAGRPMTTNLCGTDHVVHQSVLWSIFISIICLLWKLRTQTKTKWSKAKITSRRTSWRGDGIPVPGPLLRCCSRGQEGRGELGWYYYSCGIQYQSQSGIGFWWKLPFPWKGKENNSLVCFREMYKI